MKAGSGAQKVELPEGEGQYCGSIDVHEVIRSWHSSTGWKDSDFVPLASGMLLEPFMETLGHGTYNIRPSPFAGIATCLVNTNTLKSVPVPRILDMDKLFSQLAPIFANGADGLGIRQYAQVGMAVQGCVRHGFTLPDLVSKVSDQGKTGDASGKVARITRNMQFLTVQASADIFGADLVSHCWPWVLSQQGGQPGNLVRPNMGFF